MVDKCMCGHPVTAHHFQNGVHERCAHIDCNCGCYVIGSKDSDESLCICGHKRYRHFEAIVGTVCAGDNVLTDQCVCNHFDAAIDVNLVQKHYPKSRKSLSSGHILHGEQECHVIGQSWKDAADDIRKTQERIPAAVPSNVDAMQRIISKIAKLNLDINELQMQILQEYHELHTRLERVRRDLKS